MIVCCCHEKLRKQINVCRRKNGAKIESITKNESTGPSKHSNLSVNASSEISDTYESYGHNNSYAQYKLNDSYEMYIEKYQNYDHFQKFQTGEISCHSSSESTDIP